MSDDLSVICAYVHGVVNEIRRAGDHLYEKALDPGPTPTPSPSRWRCESCGQVLELRTKVHAPPTCDGLPDARQGNRHDEVVMVPAVSYCPTQVERIQGLQRTVEALEKANGKLWTENHELKKERGERMAASDSVCELVAKMHAAALGGVKGPVRGVVEDVADLRTKFDVAVGDVVRLKEENAVLRAQLVETGALLNQAFERIHPGTVWTGNPIPTVSLLGFGGQSVGPYGKTRVY